MYAVGAKKIEIFIRDQPARFGLRDHECPNTLPVPSPYLALNENFFSSTTVSTIDLPSNFYSESSNNSASSAHWHSVQPLPFPSDECLLSSAHHYHYHYSSRKPYSAHTVSA